MLPGTSNDSSLLSRALNLIQKIASMGEREVGAREGDTQEGR